MKISIHVPNHLKNARWQVDILSIKEWILLVLSWNKNSMGQYWLGWPWIRGGGWKISSKCIYQHMTTMTTCVGALWGSIIWFFEKNGILSPEMASENRPNGKSKNLCDFNAQQNQGGNYTIFRLQDHLTCLAQFASDSTNFLFQLALGVVHRIGLNG